MLSFSTEQHAIEGAIWASPNREGPFSGKLLNASGAAPVELFIQGNAALSLDDRFHESCHKRGIHLSSWTLTYGAGV